MYLETVVHARAGLLGNPSDGYYGKTRPVWWATIKPASCWKKVIISACSHIRSSTRLSSPILPNWRRSMGTQGYYGGMRLLQAACKRFYETCRARNIPLQGPNFTLSDETDIPRQVGMSGSSALRDCHAALVDEFGIHVLPCVRCRRIPHAAHWKQNRGDRALPRGCRTG